MKSVMTIHGDKIQLIKILKIGFSYNHRNRKIEFVIGSFVSDKLHHLVVNDENVIKMWLY